MAHGESSAFLNMHVVMINRKIKTKHKQLQLDQILNLLILSFEIIIINIYYIFFLSAN